MTLDTNNASIPACASSVFPLGDAHDFAVLAASTVTNTGLSIIGGHVGVTPSTAVTGFPPGTLVAGPAPTSTSTLQSSPYIVNTTADHDDTFCDTLTVTTDCALRDSVTTTPTRAPRFSLRLPIRYRTVGEPAWHDGTTENISRSGVLFRGAVFCRSIRQSRCDWFFQ